MKENQERQQRANCALTAYSPGEPLAQNASDLLADMLHLFGFKAFMDCFESAFKHFEAEKEETNAEQEKT